MMKPAPKSDQWETRAVGGLTFQVGHELQNRSLSGKASGSELADAAATVIADGMFVDNTGVAQAVAAGATVVTTFQNDGCAMIWDLFIDQPPLHEPIFERMNAEAAYNANKTCVALDPDRKFLQSFCMGTIA